MKEGEQDGRGRGGEQQWRDEAVLETKKLIHSALIILTPYLRVEFRNDDINLFGYISEVTPNSDEFCINRVLKYPSI